jgi:hypothetical protein
MRYRFGPFSGVDFITVFHNFIKIFTFPRGALEQVGQELHETISRVFTDFCEFLHDFVLVGEELLAVQNEVTLKFR